MTERMKLPDLPTFCAGPFEAMKGTTWIVGKDPSGDLCHIADIRGWGYLTGGGHALALSSEEAIAAQMKTRQFIVDAMNEKMLRDFPKIARSWG